MNYSEFFSKTLKLFMKKKCPKITFIPYRQGIIVRRKQKGWNGKWNGVEFEGRVAPT